MSTIDFTSPRARGVPYILVCISTATVFGHMSEFCVLADDCTNRQHVVLSFGVLGAFFSLLLLLGAVMAVPKLRFIEFSLSCILTSICIVLATIASLDKLQDDMTEGSLSILDTQAPNLATASVFWEIIVGFSWFALFVAVAALQHLILYGLRVEKGKEIEEDPKA